MMRADSLRETGRAAIADARSAVAALKALPADSDADRVIEGFDGIDAALNGVSGPIHLYAQVHPEADVRDAARELEQEIAALHTELSLDRDLYDRLVGIDAAALSNDVARRLHAHALRDYRRSGVDRDDETRERIRELQEELVEIGQQFDKNIVEGGRAFRIADGHAGLAGMPEDFLHTHPEADDGSVTLSTDPQDRIPFMSYAERDDLRRDYHVLAMNRAVPENLEVLPRLLAKRYELVQLLGYPSWAEYVMEDKMIASGTAAREFVDRVIALARDRAEAEYAELLEEKRTRDAAAERVEEWERIFLTEKVKTRKCGFDAQLVRPYFPYARVRDGVLRISEALYGIEIVRDDERERWHADVESYEIREPGSGKPIARFQLDMHPRDGKFKHAAMFHVAEGIADGRLPEATLVCNFPLPTDDDPALLEHDQVTTLFHEFGHLLHHLFAGEQRYLRFSGISTEWDFVEVPSQMFEEWAWDADVLRGFARHHETDEPIPIELVQRMREADEYGKGLHVLLQMYYASLSLSFHDGDPSALDLDAYARELKERITPFRHIEGTHFHAAFGHLNGYSATYYTYMWSLVIAKDLFGRFDGRLMDTATARAYRQTVLAPGGSKDAGDLVTEFLGRPFEFEAFESWLSR